MINTYKALSMEPITQLLFNSATFHVFQCLECFFHKCGLKKICFHTLCIPEMLQKKQKVMVTQVELAGCRVGLR